MTGKRREEFRPLPSYVAERQRDSALCECPNCGSAQVAVLDSRASPLGPRRGRGCRSCDYRWTTYEIRADLVEAMTVEGREQTIARVAKELGRLKEELDVLSKPKA